MKPGNIHETKYGSVTILEYNGWRDVLVQFNDQHKHQTRNTAQNIRDGRVKNPYYPSIFDRGYIGVGCKASLDGKTTPEYGSWRDMLNRCYDPKFLERSPTYQGCSVSEEWLNFQNFAEWFQDNHKEGWQLDKDILISGNKIYSPETCRFIPQELNKLLNDQKSRRGYLPQGVTRDGKGYQVQININSKPTYLGYYSSISEAAEVYKQAKELNVKRMAGRYKDEVCPLIYQALMDWVL